MAANLRARLSKIEVKLVPKATVRTDVFGDIARWAAWLKYHRQHGRFPPSAPATETRRLLHDLAWIEGTCRCAKCAATYTRHRAR